MKLLAASKKSISNPSQPHQATPFFSGGTHKKSSFFSGDTYEEPSFFGKTVQAKTKNNVASTNPDSITAANNSAKNETGMPTSLKSGLEDLSGLDLSGVRVHRNSSKPEAIQAHAYTQGQDIYLGPGQEKYLPHEGWHVVQQMQGRVVPTIQKKDALINDDASLEREADIMGNRAVQMKSKDALIKTGKNRASTNSGVIQRAMKLEWQMDRGNHLFRDTGKKVKPLPRKYGPEDYIVKGASGVRLESETGGVPEFETGWEKKWSKLEKQVIEAQDMAKQINAATDVTGSDGNTYKELPFTKTQLKHLTAGQGFSTTGTKWNRSQKTGKRLVSKSKENVRSSPEYDAANPDVNKIGEVTKGTKLKVVSEKGDWVQFKSADIDGWIWRNSTIPETKSYESNKNTAGEYIDTELRAGERLLAKIGDTTWVGSFQVSESFELEQFESYLENDSNFEPLVSLNTNDLMSLPSVSGGSNELKNFLLMVVYFIQRARMVSLKKSSGGFHPAKAAFTLMNRTNFGSIYKSSNLTNQDRAIFKTLVEGTSEGILPALGLNRSTKVFVDGQGAGYNPTVYYWLKNITNNRDILSGPTGHVSGAMGKHDINTEQGKNKNLVRFENRSPEVSLRSGDRKDRTKPVTDWLTFAKLWFDKAANERPRATGKGRTGLEK